MEIRLLFSLVLAAIVIYFFYRNTRHEREAALFGRVGEPKPGRLTPRQLSPGVFLGYFLGTSLLYLVWGEAAAIPELLLSIGVLITLYLALLLPLMPLLRRFFSPGACAALWGLPTFLALGFFTWRRHFVRPSLILRLPQGLFPWLAGLWLMGAAAVLLWKVGGHLSFRRRVLKDARPVEDREVLALWGEQQEPIERKTPIPLLISPALTSPLTIGLDDSALRTLLPDKAYTREELTLIFRHELRHVQRRDVDVKVFYTLCEALCWFHPLVWAAARQASADLERSCDETVLAAAQPEERQRYAQLLLTEAQEETGFTTCLSASGQALRQRLREAVSPKRRLPGFLLLGAVMAALVLLDGQVAVSTQQGRAADLFLAQYTDFVPYDDGLPWPNGPLMEALGDLPLTRLSSTDLYLPDGTPLDFILALHAPDGDNYLQLWLSGDLLRLESAPGRSALYHIDGPVDADALNTLKEGETTNE